MKAFICCKQVPDVAMPFQIKDSQLVTDGLNYVLNAYDASSVEAALVMRETHTDVQMEISLVTIGPDKAREAMRKGLAMGADNGFHLIDDAFDGGDSVANAGLLAKFFADKEYDFILLGKQAQDVDMGLSGGVLAGHLNLPYVTNAVGLEADPASKKLIVKRQGDEGVEIIEVPFPCIVTCSNDMNDPRIASLKGIMASKKKPVESIDAGGLGIDVSEVGSSGAKTKLVSWAEPPARKPGEQFEGDADELVKILIDKLTNEAKVL